MSYQDLLDECERDGIGSRFWNLLLAVAGRVARRYPPEVYNDAEQWSVEAIQDLAQDVALYRLLHENQLEYVLSLATDEDSLSRLLAFQVRRVLNHRRSRTVVDRLLTRIRQFDLAAEFQLTAFGSDQFLSPSGSGREPARLSDAEIRRGSTLINPIPRLVSNPTAERESRVYSRSDLMELVRVLVEEFNGISLGDVRRILETTLTAWLPTILRDHEEDHVEQSTPELEAQRSEMRTAISGFVTGLSSVHRVVLLGKAQGLSDSELASRLGRSRPWLADRKHEALEMVERSVMSGLPSVLHDEAARLLLDEAAALEPHDD
ncbi:MAG: hypothetical protein F4236_05020 [Acidimicrobiia bacterium]|nr:hypothetical protein [Acidimicrobiia bacterium]